MLSGHNEAIHPAAAARREAILAAACMRRLFTLSPLDRILARRRPRLARRSTARRQAARPKPVAAAARRPPLDDAERAPRRRADARQSRRRGLRAGAVQRAGAGHRATRRCARQFERPPREETDHLAWTQSACDELGARPSLLNPLWYAGAFGDRPARRPRRRRASAWASWSRPSARSSATSKATWTGCRPATSRRAPSSRR